MKQFKRQAIERDNRNENRSRLNHTHHIGDEVLVVKERKSECGEDPCDGPYRITRVNSNGTMRMRKGAAIEPIDMRNLMPCRRDPNNN